MLNNLKEIKIFKNLLKEVDDGLVLDDGYVFAVFEKSQKDVIDFMYQDGDMEENDKVVGTIYFKLGQGIKMLFDDNAGDYSKGDRAYYNIIEAFKI